MNPPSSLFRFLETVLRRELFEGSHFAIYPRLILAQLSSKQGRHLRGHLDGRVRVEKKSSGSPCEHIFHRSRHLVSGCPHDFCSNVWQVGMKLLRKVRMQLYQLPYFFGIRPIDSQAIEAV